MRLRLTSLLFPILCIVPPAGAQDIPATSSTILTEIQQGGGAESDQLVYVMNNSSHAIVVTSIRLMECENIQGSCGVRRMKHRIAPGGRALVQRIRARAPDQPTGFRYTFTWEQEAAEGPTAKDVEKDKTALVVDTVIVQPKLVDLKVGETLDLGQVLVIKARNAAGQELPRIYFHVQIVIGEDFIALDGSKLTGRSPGTAALLVSASTVSGPVPATKGASKIVVHVTSPDSARPYSSGRAFSRVTDSPRSRTRPSRSP